MPQNAVKSPRGLTSVRRPIVLTSEVTVDANSTKSPDLLRLRNPTEEHFVIREIRFSVRSASGSAYLIGGTVSAKLDLGTQPLTNAHVPVWSFGRYISRDADGATNPHAVFYDTACLFRWKLQHPLYVPAKAVLACEFQHKGIIKVPLTVAVTYIGHTLGTPTIPSRVKLPWVASYSSKIFNRTDADTDVSSATALINPFSIPVYLERFTGRLGFQEAGLALVYSFAANHTLLLKMVHSSGAPLVREFTPFRQVFGAYSHSWEQRGSVLDPGAFYIASINKLADADEPVGDLIFADVGMVGWRELNLVGGEAK